MFAKVVFMKIAVFAYRTRFYFAWKVTLSPTHYPPHPVFLGRLFPGRLLCEVWGPEEGVWWNDLVQTAG